LGVKLRYVDSSFAKLVEDLTQDRCDVAMFAVGITAARAEKLKFSQPYLVSDIYAITTKSNRRIKTWDDIDQTGVVVSVAKGTAARVGDARQAQSGYFVYQRNSTGSGTGC